VNERSLEKKWRTLGISYRFRDESSDIFYLPEDILIASCNYDSIKENKTFISHLLMWVADYNKLIHVDLIKKKFQNLTPLGVVILWRVIKEIQDHEFDSRWNVILKMCEQSMNDNDLSNLSLSRDSKRGFKGEDSHLSTLGVYSIPLTPTHKKKIYKRERVLGSNIWLRNRVLFGTNLRADIFTIIENEICSSPYQCSKYLDISLKTAYQHWNSIKEFQSLEINKDYENIEF
jgi:hypothetical protein